MYCNSILIYSYFAEVTVFEGIELEAKQAEKKYNTGCIDTSIGKTHNHTITNTISEECAHINERYQ
jgi:hypothetical protein